MGAPIDAVRSDRVIQSAGCGLCAGLVEAVPGGSRDVRRTG